MRVKRLVEIIAVTLLIIAAITIKDYRFSDSFSLKRSTVNTVAVPLAAKALH